MRSADKVKPNASSETGAWAHCNPYLPGGKAENCAPLMLGSWPKKAVNNPAANRPPAFSGNPAYLIKTAPARASQGGFLVYSVMTARVTRYSITLRVKRSRSIRHGPFGLRRLRRNLNGTGKLA